MSLLDDLEDEDVDAKPQPSGKLRPERYAAIDL